ncbi:MAG: hypothetical protein R8J94_14650 [Acidimicrobiia bacterium]|nr:hypothetical protein [Acidimicrobiia bacterium]
MNQISLPRSVVGVVAVFALLSGAVVGVRSLRSDDCAPHDDSVATAWTEAALDAIRRDFPAPTVHSRNLYHLSAAMWDVWAAYDPSASGAFVDSSRMADDSRAARDEAISFAAHRLLTQRYRNSTGAEESLTQFDQTLESLCFTVDQAENRGRPASFGVEVADFILDESLDDGALELDGYSGPHVRVSQHATRR